MKKQKHWRLQLDPSKGRLLKLLRSWENVERFVVHRKFLSHPYFAMMLDLAAQEFGYREHGILRIPCDIAHFQFVVGLIAKRKRKFLLFSFTRPPLIKVQSYEFLILLEQLLF
ncbi:Auxin-responsive protein SAUR40 [Carex littledalei]|uniref:Auxin-responsive protein SAUR40 n=1 Tax=Carex littledalei TaxID=544730 RepID=A0A833RDP9_9POAL|nr:Auxin-responsive protein SAUR40 [Carex littledalei]